MKKVKKVLSVILIVSVVICSLYVGIHTIYLQSHRSEAVDYLVEKYEFDSKRLILLDYEPSKFNDDTDLGIPFDWYWSLETWKFSYESKTFGVSKSEYGFSDDYQLEEIFEWATEYLKTVDPNVVGIKIDYGKLQEIVKKDEIEDFLTNVNDSFVIYYKVENLEDYYKVSSNGFKFTNENFDTINSKVLKKYDFINKNINNKGITLTNSDIEFSRKKYDNFASYYYDTKIPCDRLYEKGIVLWLKEIDV